LAGPASGNIGKRVPVKQGPTMSQSQSSPPATALGQALEQNETIRDSVEQSAAELLVINTVLKQELPDDVQIGEIAQALQKTDELETRIQESAEELAEVNQVLAQEIDQRADLERELAATREALARAQAAGG
jgi:phosphoglycerate-specific signal transduction histidine kinase